MKGIFISQAILNRNNGGGQFVCSLIRLLEKVVGKNNLTVISLPSEFDEGSKESVDDNLIIYKNNPTRFQKIRNMVYGCPRYVNPNIFDKTVDLIRKKDYDFVFLGFSTYKYLIEKIKKETKLPVFVMYQGIAPNTKKSRVINENFFQKLKTYPSYRMVLNRERKNVKLSDCNIVHNRRERDVFFYYYHKEPDLYLPVFIADRFNTEREINPGYVGFSLLFIGSNFGPNLSGLKWFIENVMPYVNKEVYLYVIGQGMEFLRDIEPFRSFANCVIIGEVDRLEPWYYYADLVVEPIFEGDGMKTKTVEAMMFGKTILGTEEAFCGYEGLDEYLCNTADEFIQMIEYYRKNGVERTNNKIRTVYLEKYSEKVMLEVMREAITNYVCIEKNV